MKIISDLFAPLILAASNKEDLNYLLEELGWVLEFNDFQHEVFNSILGVVEPLELIISVTDDIQSEGISGENVEELITLTQGIFNSVQNLSQVDPSQILALPAPLNSPDTWAELALKLPNYLVVSWLEIYLPSLYEAMYFVGLVEEEPREEPLPPEKIILWDKLSEFISDPTALIMSTYKWGVDFLHAEFIRRFVRITYALGFFPIDKAVREELIADWTLESLSNEIQEVEIPLFNRKSEKGTSFIKSSFVVAPIADPATNIIKGLGITNFSEGTWNSEIEISDEFLLTSNGTGNLNRALEARILPEGVEFGVNAGIANAEFTLESRREVPWLVFGTADSARLEIAGVSVTLAVNPTPEILLSAKTHGGLDQGIKIVIAPGEGDSFISKILGDNELSITSDLGFVWSSETGFQFDGGVGFDVQIPTNIKVGPIRVDLVRLALQGGSEGAQVEAVITGGVDLDVLAIVVDGIGIRAGVIPMPEGDTSGLLGPIDLEFGFKPPNGLGLVIDGAGIVTGGGYLEHDPDIAQYAGVAEIGFLNLGLSAVGVLTTRMPDGSDGWSLFLSVFSEFPPLQIGFGFTLNGVGGLIGINRTLDDDALRERLLQGALDSIMFPEDPVLNAPTIINDIEAVFPPAQNQFIFGAMLKFGWGTPSLVTVDLGVMVELPDPIRIALMGQLEAILPTPDVRILELHMDVFGLADLTAQTFALDAVIRDSHIVELLTLSGDMALRADLLDQPTLLLAVGGFSPRFKAPAEFPKLRQMRASVPVGLLATVDLSCYVAFTSNTFQMGGRVDVWAKFVGFTAEGFVEMDALIQFVPFGFQFHTGFGVTVRAGKITLMGVEVSADLSGPSPWEVFGTATFEILKIKKDIHLEIRVGKEKKNIAEKYDVSALLATALLDPDSWSVPEEGELAAAVRLRERDADEEPAVHPAGRVQVTQRIVPLNTEIEVFGGGKIQGASRFSVDQVLIGDESRPPAKDEFIEEWFAPSQFFKMKDKEKIEAPSFELMENGLRFGSDDIASGSATELEVEYEEIVLDPKLNLRRRAKFAKALPAEKQLAKVEKYGSAAQARAKNQRFRKTVVKPAYRIKDQKFVATHLSTGDLAEAIAGANGKSYAETASLVRKQNQAALSPLEQFGVVPHAELASGGRMM